MAFANRLADAVVKAVNSNAVINTCLVASFVALSMRSLKQQKDIEALESEKESLVQANKAMKKTMWDWKQQLFAEASTGSPLIPLDRLKSIYGEAPTTAPGEAMKEDTKSSSTKFVV